MQRGGHVLLPAREGPVEARLGAHPRACLGSRSLARDGGLLQLTPGRGRPAASAGTWRQQVHSLWLTGMGPGTPTGLLGFPRETAHFHSLLCGEGAGGSARAVHCCQALLDPRKASPAGPRPEGSTQSWRSHACTFGLWPSAPSCCALAGLHASALSPLPLALAPALLPSSCPFFRCSQSSSAFFPASTLHTALCPPPRP